MDFLISINTFTTSKGHWQICVEHILTRNASQPDREEVKMNLMLASMTNNIFTRISTIIHPKVFTLYYSVHLEMLAVAYWNPYLALNCQREKATDVSGLYQIMVSLHETVPGHMMTSSNGNFFCVTCPLCGEFTGDRWIPLTKASDAELWCSLSSDGWVNNRYAGNLRRHCAHYDATVMCGLF